MSRIESGDVKELYFDTYRGAVVTVRPDTVTAERNGQPTPMVADGFVFDLQHRRAHTDEWRALSTWDKARREKVAALRSDVSHLESLRDEKLAAIAAWKPGTLIELREGVRL